MSHDAERKNEAIEALQQYREALTTVEELEQEEAAAHRAVTDLLSYFEIAIVEHHAPLVRHDVFRTGQTVIYRLDETRHTLIQATMRLDFTYRKLAALDQALGYIPILPMVNADSREFGSNA